LKRSRAGEEAFPLEVTYAHRDAHRVRTGAGELENGGGQPAREDGLVVGIEPAEGGIAAATGAQRVLVLVRQRVHEALRGLHLYGDGRRSLELPEARRDLGRSRHPALRGEEAVL